MTILNMMAAIQARTMSGAFNDMDMLEVGNGGQTDAEYVLHFSMWALNASPLLVGTHVPGMSPATLSIYANPAVIAVNQDASASAAVRKWRVEVEEKDGNGQGEIALWTRGMANGDTVVALLNAGNVSRVMSAEAKDIFLDEGQGHLRDAWEVYDLWANRMSEAEAARVLNGTGASLVVEGGNSTTRYNATRMSYEQGLKANATALFGAKVGMLSAGGTLTATVDRHSIGLFRLRRSVGLRKRDEL
jgi:alpha-galactosidase